MEGLIMKLGRWLAASLIVLMLAAPAAAAPKLAGEWLINGNRVNFDGTFGVLPTMDMVLNATTDPTLFYGTFTGPEGDTNYITLMMDAGANMHFTISVFGQNDTLGHPHTCTTGRGTASTRIINGSWSDDIGTTGTFKMTRKPLP
jgi:hypothetical protein